MTPFKAIRLAPLALLLLTACGGGKIPPTRYYSLDLPAAPQPSANVSGRQSVAVARFDASEMLTQDRIVYRPTREEVGFYEYHRWAEDPRTSIRRSLMAQLQSSGAFSAVAPYDGRTKTDFLLRGRVEQLEEVDFEGGVKVYARVAAELIDLSNNRVVWQGSGSSSGAVGESDMRAVVGQMSSAVKTSLDQIVTALTTHMRS